MDIEDRHIFYTMATKCFKRLSKVHCQDEFSGCINGCDPCASALVHSSVSYSLTVVVSLQSV